MSDNQMCSKPVSITKNIDDAIVDHGLNGRLLFIGGFKIDPATHTLSKGEVEVRLEPRAINLLVYLAERKSQVVSREELESEIWRDIVVGYDALNSTIAKIRKAFGDDPKNPSIILTIPKAGYQLIAEVSVDDPSVNVKTVSMINKKSVVTGFVLILLIGLLAWIKPWGDNDRLELPDKPSIVVLPFKNLSADPDQDILSTAISNSITNQLSLFDNLFVISTNSANFYQTTNKTPKQIGAELGVKYILNGDIQRINNRLRASLWLINVQTNAQVWTEKYDRIVNDIFVLQDDIVDSVASSLGEKIFRDTVVNLKSKPIEDFTAFDFHLKALKTSLEFNQESNWEARRLWQHALEIDADLSYPYIGIAYTYFLDYRAQWVDTGDEVLDIADQYLLQGASKKTGADEAMLQRMHSIISQVRGNYNKALTHIERSLELNPNDGDSLGVYAKTLYVLGRGTEALDRIDDAILRNPHYPGWYASVRSITYYLLGEYQSAIDSLNKVSNLTIWDHRYLAASYAQLGRIEEANKHVEVLVKQNPNLSLSAFKSKIKLAKESDIQHFVDGLKKAGFPE